MNAAELLNSLPLGSAARAAVQAQLSPPRPVAKPGGGVRRCATVREGVKAVAVTLAGLRLRGGGNAREHYMARCRRVRAERQRVALAFVGLALPCPPVVVLMVYICPARIDPDNLAGKLKGVQDEVAALLGVDDGDENAVRFARRQRRGPFAVGIRIIKRKGTQ